MDRGEPVIIGTRKSKGADVQVRQPWWRETMGKIYTFLARLVLGVPVSDFTCGFKMFRRSARESIWRQGFMDRWSYDAEILYLAQRFGFPIREVPVVWRNDKRSAVRIFRDAVQSFTDLFLIRFKYSGIGGTVLALGCSAEKMLYHIRSILPRP